MLLPQIAGRAARNRRRLGVEGLASYLRVSTNTMTTTDHHTEGARAGVDGSVTGCSTCVPLVEELKTRQIAQVCVTSRYQYLDDALRMTK